MSDTNSRFIYFIDRENVLFEMEAEDYSVTSGTTAIRLAQEYCDAFNFRLFTIEAEQWEPEDWERAYSDMENVLGLYTPERRAELFDI